MKKILILLLAITPIFCFADNGTNLNLSLEITRTFTKLVSTWANNLTNRVVFPMFWTLSLISLTWKALSLALKGADLPDIIQELFSFIMVTGFWAWYIQNAESFSLIIINSFTKAAGIANNVPIDLKTTDILKFAVDIPIVMIKESDGISGAFMAIVCGAIVMICYTYIAIIVMLAYIQNYVLIGAGIIVLGFAGSPWTNNYAKNYIISVFAAGLKLFFIYIIVGIGVDFARQITVGELDYSIKENIVTVTVLSFMIAYFSGKSDVLTNAILSGSAISSSSLGSVMSKALTAVAAAGGAAFGASQLAQSSAAAAKSAVSGGSTGNPTLDWAAKGFQDETSSRSGGFSSSDNSSLGSSFGSFGSSGEASGASPKPMTPDEQRKGAVEELMKQVNASGSSSSGKASQTKTQKAVNTAMKATKATGVFTRCMVNGIGAGIVARVKQQTLTPKGTPASDYVEKHFNKSNTDLSKDY